MEVQKYVDASVPLIGQGGVEISRMFLNLTLGAAYALSNGELSAYAAGWRIIPANGDPEMSGELRQ